MFRFTADSSVHEISRKECRSTRLMKMNYLKQLRKDAGLSQEDVAKSLGVSRQTYCNYENGVRKMSPAMLLRVSNFYNISTDDLLRGSDQTEPIDIGETYIYISKTRPLSRSTRIPVLESVSASTSLEAVENKDVLEWVEIPIGMTSEGQKYFALKVKDDTMFPEYMVGDTVIVLQQSWCDNVEDCVVCANESNGVIVTVRLNADGGMTLTTKNSRYPPQTFSQQQVSDYPVRIMGVVVEIRRRIKPINTGKKPYIQHKQKSRP